MTKRSIASAVLLPIMLGLAEVQGGAPTPTLAGHGTISIDFSRQIRPILSENCFACHGPDDKQRKAKLRLDTKPGAFAALRSGGFALVAGKPAASVLITRIQSADPGTIMPPPKSHKQLTAAQIELMRQWVEQGAPWAEHWAFVPPVRPALPKASDPTWPRNSIDRFILARLDTARLRPSPEADRATLIRRVSLDLTGLPPTFAEVTAYLEDPAPDAYEQAVNRLLQSPRYGEHMARYWLDVARYGDTHGLHLDNYREMWPYRAWVIKAFNDNLPFDQFLTEQLAGDLLPNATLEALVASGFNRCHVSTSEGGSIDEEVYVRNVVDRVDTTGTVFLGLTIGCARCHDHKYDPIRAKDYYQLFAFFNSLDDKPLDGNADLPPPVVRLPTREQGTALAALDRKIAGYKQTIAAEVAKVAVDPAAQAKQIQSLAAWLRMQRLFAGVGLPEPLRAIVKLEPARRNQEQQKQFRDHFLEHVDGHTRSVFRPLHEQLAAAQKLREQISKQVPATLVSQELKQLRPAFVLKRGEYDQRAEQVGRAIPAFLPTMTTNMPHDRLGFAQWLLAPNHPLTARVAVNRLWQQFFGAGLVRTAEDFGSQGEPPSHPELLDWLAVQFREDGWDVKKTVQRIVLSSTYRQSTKVTPDRLARDPANRLLSRAPRYRLDAEILRDQALAISGLLVERLGGASVKPPQPAGLWEAVGYTSSNTARFVADHGNDKVHRRSMYTFWKRTSAPPQMTILDAPSREACTVRRERTDTPLQALLLMNEPQFVECARALAEQTLHQAAPTPEARIRYLFQRATARTPTAQELAVLLAAYQMHRATYANDLNGALALIAVGETKPDPTLEPRELAPWTLMGNLVLNLDEVMNKG